jgi:hypothetical protein
MRVAVFQQHGNGRVHRHIVGAFLNQDLADLAFIDGFDFHGRLVGLDLGDDIAGADIVTFLDQPFGQVALLHGGRQGGHQDVPMACPASPYAV